MDIAVLPPDVNRSGAEFTVLEGKICFGLSAIKGCGAAAATALAAERAAHGPVSQHLRFLRTARSRHGQPRGHRIARSRPGRSIRLGGHRSQFFAAFDRAMQAGAAAANDRRSGQMGLFGGDDDDQPETVARPICPTCPPGTSASGWPRRKKCWASTFPAIRWPSTKRR